MASKRSKYITEDSLWTILIKFNNKFLSPKFTKLENQIGSLNTKVSSLEKRTSKIEKNMTTKQDLQDTKDELQTLKQQS